MPTCSVVIVNFNAGPYLRATVASLIGSSAVSEIIVVDNASTDDSLDLLPQDPRLHVVRNEKNLGFAAGCNIGLKRSDSEYAMLLNPDCVVRPGAIERLMAVAGLSERIGMTGPLLLNEDGSEQAGGRRKIPTPKLAFIRATGLSRVAPAIFDDFALHLRPVPAEPTEIEAISGACMMVRRAAIDDVGLLDEGYFLHCEDLDWCMRFLQKGWTIVFVPDAIVIHHKGISSHPHSLQTELHKHRGMARFYRKFFAGRHPPWTRAIFLAGIWTRFAGVTARIRVVRSAERVWKNLRSES